jgi:ABC-type amino acid transport system permease subunit
LSDHPEVMTPVTALLVMVSCSVCAAFVAVRLGSAGVLAVLALAVIVALGGAPALVKVFLFCFALFGFWRWRRDGRSDP